MEYDLTPIFEIIIQGVAGVLLALGSFAIHKLNKWIEAKTHRENFISEDIVRKYMHSAIDRSVEYAVGHVRKADWARVETKNELVALAVNHASKSAPDALRSFGVDRDHLEEMITAKLLKHDKNPGEWND